MKALVAAGGYDVLFAALAATGATAAAVFARVAATART
jgi:hypothetical protein